MGVSLKDLTCYISGVLKKDNPYGNILRHDFIKVLLLKITNITSTDEV